MLVITTTVGHEPQERAVALVGLRDQHLALAEPRVRAQADHAPADDRGRVEPARREHLGGHRGRRGLAGRAADRHAVLHAHQLGEHLGARDHGDAGQLGGAQLRVRGAEPRTSTRPRRRLRRARRRGRSRSRMPSSRMRSGRRALAQVRARHRVALRVQDLGDPRHADAADADEVHALDAPPHRAPPSAARAGAARSRAAASGRRARERGRAHARAPRRVAAAGRRRARPGGRPAPHPAPPRTRRRARARARWPSGGRRLRTGRGRGSRRPRRHRSRRRFRPARATTQVRARHALGQVVEERGDLGAHARGVVGRARSRPRSAAPVWWVIASPGIVREPRQAARRSRG